MSSLYRRLSVDRAQTGIKKLLAELLLHVYSVRFG